jgi:hypothetical protein
MQSHRCHYCGYDLAGIDAIEQARKCPECGRTSPDEPPPGPWWIEHPGRIDLAMTITGSCCVVLAYALVVLDLKQGVHSHSTLIWLLLVGAFLTAPMILIGTWLWTRLPRQRAAAALPHRLPRRSRRERVISHAIVCFLIAPTLAIATLVIVSGVLWIFLH